MSCVVLVAPARCLFTPWSSSLAAIHSITSSARARSVAGTVMPSALAVFILMTSWKRVGCSTGKSAGWAPFRILSTYTAALRKRSAYIAEYDISPPSSANHRGTETAGAKERRAVHLRAGAVRCCNPTVRGGRRPILASGLPSSGEGVAHPGGGGLDDVRP